MGDKQERWLFRRLETGMLWGATKDYDGWNLYLGLWCLTVASRDQRC